MAERLCLSCGRNQWPPERAGGGGGERSLHPRRGAGWQMDACTEPPITKCFNIHVVAGFLNTFWFLSRSKYCNMLWFVYFSYFKVLIWSILSPTGATGPVSPASFCSFGNDQRHDKCRGRTPPASVPQNLHPPLRECEVRPDSGRPGSDSVWRKTHELINELEANCVWSSS